MEKERSLSPLVLGILLAASTAARGADWPHFLGPKADGFAPDKGVNRNWAQKPPAVLWKAVLSDNGYSGPSVAGEKVFILDHKDSRDILRAIDMDKGTNLWERSFHVGNDPAYSTPVHDGGKIYLVSRLGHVNCVGAGDGAPIWSVDLAKEYGSVAPTWKHSWSPVVDGQALLLTAGGPEATIVALDKTNGRLLWKGGGTDGAGYAPVVTATLAGKKCYIVSAQTSIRAVDTTGLTIWSFPWENKYKVNAAAPIVKDGYVFVTSGYGKGCALIDGKTGQAVWQNTQVVSHMSTPIVSGEHIYATSDPGKLVCMEFKSGKVKWEQAGFEKGGLCAVDGTLILLDGKNGDVVQAAIDSSEYRELGRLAAPLGGQSWTAPIVSSGRLIIRNKQQLACIDIM